MVSRDELAKMREFIRELPPGETVYDRVLTWFEFKALHGFTSTVDEANRRDQNQWSNSEELSKTFTEYSPDQQQEQFEHATDIIGQRLADIGVAYHSMTAKDGPPEDVLKSIQEAYLALENPLIQESVLLAVDDHFEPLVREWMEDMRNLLIGWIHASAGIESPFTEVYLERCPEDLQELFSQRVEENNR